MDSTCTFDGCDKPVRSSGLCASHYNQWLKKKELKPLQVQYHGLSESVRFMRRVDKSAPNGCWNWTGSRMNRSWHGQWRNSAGEHEMVHRAAWRMFVGPIPDGMFVLHRCDNPVCLNPSHLFLGTQTDNMNDMWLKKRARPRALLGSRHGGAKLTEDKVLEIRKSILSGIELAKIYGVSPTTICDIRKRRIWNHI